MVPAINLLETVESHVTVTGWQSDDCDTPTIGGGGQVSVNYHKSAMTSTLHSHFIIPYAYIVNNYLGETITTTLNSHFVVRIYRSAPAPSRIVIPALMKSLVVYLMYVLMQSRHKKALSISLR